MQKPDRRKDEYDADYVDIGAIVKKKDQCLEWRVKSLGPYNDNINILT